MKQIKKQPRTVVYQKWTPPLIQSAKVLADGGQLRLAADLCEEIMHDDRVQGVLGARVRGLLSLGLTFLPGEGPDAEALVTEINNIWNKDHADEDLVQLCSWGLLLGVGVARKVWYYKDNGFNQIELRSRLEVWHPRWLRYDYDQNQWFIRVGDAVNEEPIIPGDGEWILYTPYGTQRPWSSGLWHSIARWWLAKQYSVEDWARHSEIHGTPIRSAMAPQGTDKDSRKALANDLANLGPDTSLVPPPGWELKLVEATARTWEMFGDFIEAANLAISITIAGANLSSEVTAGSLAAAKVHGDIRQEMIRSDAKTLANCLREQSLKPWALYLTGDPEAAPWPVWDAEPPADDKAQGEGMTALAQGIEAVNTALAPYKKRVNVEQLLEGVVELEDLTEQNNMANQNALNSQIQGTS